ncbi:BLUF domain-containing protein [Marinobacter arenosus]|uniref:BLUF domain-containing protein n=1 Tax=Marinobacter arenosus TaxID=2856822 RepID=UPI001C4CB21E|nr:BLUF domain-containing protein [Marinobacter arenosus]MBW0146979.1 BLUF domain-containing protein [Marinobacter arenosus]
MSLMRLAYASEATFEAKPAEKGVEPNVARILMTSRRNNGKCLLVGGLYYGDNRFFQYLEGDEKDVLETYRRIQSDSRHKNIVTLIEEPLEARTFENWSMKYVPLSSDVHRFLKKHGLSRFDPASFSSTQCEEMIQLIRSSSQDLKLVNHDEDGTFEAKSQVLSTGLRNGLIAAALFLVGALFVAGSML